MESLYCWADVFSNFTILSWAFRSSGCKARVCYLFWHWVSFEKFKKNFIDHMIELHGRMGHVCCGQYLLKKNMFNAIYESQTYIFIRAKILHRKSKVMLMPNFVWSTASFLKPVIKDAVKEWKIVNNYI